jgi:MFS family permease
MKKWIPILILALAQFVMVLDGTVMNVSISTVASDLGTTITGMQTAITVFTLTMAAFMLTGGKLGDILGRQKAFRIGSVIYGIGSLTTAIAPTLGVLFLGWSIIEGLGAVLVIPAIAALAAANYKGKDRGIAFPILGLAIGLATALGPVIGGYVTTYLSWRYVFAAETIIMVFVLVLSRLITDAKVTEKVKLDVLSVILSASGMALLVFGVLQSRSWGWIKPLGAPQINGNDITPFGISLVAYLIVAGIIVLKLFYDRQVRLAEQGKQPLLKVSMFKMPVLRSGLMMLTAQFFTIAALFFIIPVYLQTILGYNALDTGLKLVPLSIGLLIFTVLGARRASVKSARRIVRSGQLIMALGALLVLSAITPELGDTLFWFGLFCIGAGFGLLASQLGNVTMSAVTERESAEVGGLQGVFQNLGLSFGTAMIGSVFILSLTSGFTSAIQNNPNLSSSAKTAITQQAENGVGIVSKEQANQYVIDSGGSDATAAIVADTYQNSQLESLRISMFFVFAFLIASLFFSRNLPVTVTSQKPA